MSIQVYLLGIYQCIDAEQVPVIRHEVTDVSQFGWFTRKSMKEVLSFGAQTVIGRTLPGTRQKLHLQDTEFVLYAQVHQQLGAIVIAGKDYPEYAAHVLLQRLLSTQHEELNTLLITAQTPAQVDQLIAVNEQLDEIKDVMHSNIDLLLKRGESLDELARKSDALSEHSKLFFGNAKRMNRCCKLY